MVLFYCEKCGVRVDPEDLQAGTARKLNDSSAICLSCSTQEREALMKTPIGAPAVFESSETEVLRGDDPISVPTDTKRQSSRAVSTLPARPASTVVMPTRPGSSTSTRATRAQSARIPAAEPETPAGPNKWLAFAFGAGMVLIGVAIALLRPFGGGSNETAAKENPREPERRETLPPPEPPAQQKQTLPPEPPPEPVKTYVRIPPPDFLDERSKEAHNLLQDAKAFQFSAPQDVEGYAHRLDQLFQAFRTTPAGQEAQSLLKAIQYPDPQTQLAPDTAWSNATNLFSLIDTGKDVVKGKWKKDGAGLNLESEQHSRVQIPYEPPEEYDFRVTFTRNEGDADVNMIMPAQGRVLMWSMGASKNTTLGFECVNNKDASSNGVNVKSSKALENKKKYTCIVQVRKRVVRAFLDGKIVKEYRTNFSEFTMRNEWKLKNERLLGLGGHSSKIVFEKAELRTVSGTGKKIR